MGENFLVPSTQIAHDFMVHTLNMAVQVGPAIARDVAAEVWAIVA